MWVSVITVKNYSSRSSSRKLKHLFVEISDTGYIFTNMLPSTRPSPSLCSCPNSGQIVRQARWPVSSVPIPEGTASAVLLLTWRYRRPLKGSSFVSCDGFKSHGPISVERRILLRFMHILLAPLQKRSPSIQSLCPVRVAKYERVQTQFALSLSAVEKNKRYQCLSVEGFLASLQVALAESDRIGSWIVETTRDLCSEHAPCKATGLDRPADGST